MKTQSYKVTATNEVLTIEIYSTFIYVKERDCKVTIEWLTQAVEAGKLVLITNEDEPKTATAEQIKNVLTFKGQLANQVLQLMTNEEKDKLGTMPRAFVPAYKEAMLNKYSQMVKAIESEWL